MTFNNKKEVKISDFNTSILEEETFISQNITPMFYRPPEIFLGSTYSTKLDIWSFGCMIYELYTGSVLFTGETCFDVIKSIFDIRGKPSKKFLSKGKFSSKYFKENGNMYRAYVDSILHKSIINEVSISHNGQNYILQKLKYYNSIKDKSIQSNDKDIHDLNDFIEKCLVVDPNKRLSSIQLLTHEFISI